MIISKIEYVALSFNSNLLYLSDSTRAVILQYGPRNLRVLQMRTVFFLSKSLTKKI